MDAARPIMKKAESKCCRFMVEEGRMTMDSVTSVPKRCPNFKGMDGHSLEIEPFFAHHSSCF
jgi:hypothetical protein